MIKALLQTGFGAFATTLGFRVSRRLQRANKHWDVWDVAAALMKIVGPWIAIAVFALALYAAGRMSRPTAMVVTRTVSLPEFGLQVTLPSTWKLEPGQSGTDFVAAHSDTGAVLAGAVVLSDPAAPNLDAAIDRIVEDQRARAGTVDNISRGVMALELLDARWVEFSLKRSGEAMRMRTVAVQRGAKILTLTCTGGAAAQQECKVAIRSVAMAH